MKKAKIAIFKCRSCGSKIVPFFSLGRIPLANTFLTKHDLSKKEKKYDLTVAFCKKCYLVQLTKNMSPRQLFEEYIYFSSNSSSLKRHFEESSIYLAKKFKLTKRSLVLEIASNDGIFLKYFKKLGIGILGIDPAKNIAEVANKSGIKTLTEFFNLKLAKKLKKDGVMADLIYGANVLAHVPNIVNFTKGVSRILKPKGTAIFEFPYLKGLFENKFDIIYHEHVFYYSLIALINLFKQAQLDIYNIEFTDIQGGSLRIYLCHEGVIKINYRVRNLQKKEKLLGYDKIETYRKIKTNVEKIKKDLFEFISKLKKNGKSIAAYSAPAKGNIFLNYMGINSNYLDFIVDKAREKQGLYTPGTHMLVEDPSEIYKRNPDYLLVLCWNIADEIIREHDKYRKSGGKFAFAVPKLKIIS